MGGFGLRDKNHAAGRQPAGNEFREWISAAHIVWTKENPEFLRNSPTSSQEYFDQCPSPITSILRAGGLRLPWLDKTLKPYYRFEHTHTPSANRFSPSGPGGSIVGLRYDITNYEVLRASTATPSACPRSSRERGPFFQTDFTF